MLGGLTSRHFIGVEEAEIRDIWYSHIVSFLIDKRIDTVVIPEMVVKGTKRADLVIYICRSKKCTPLVLLEFKKYPYRNSIYSQIEEYAEEVNPRYYASVTLYPDDSVGLDFYNGKGSGRFSSNQEALGYFKQFLLRATGEPFVPTIPKDQLIREKILNRSTFEPFMRAEFVRILNGSGMYAISECNIIYNNGNRRADLVVFRDKSSIEYDYPSLVLEFKSEITYEMREQIEEYRDALRPYYYGVVYGEYLPSGSAVVEIYKDGKPVLSKRFNLSCSHLDSSKFYLDIVQLLWASPPPKFQPLNGVFTTSQLVQMGAKILRGVTINNGIYGFRLLTDEQGNRIPNHDYRVIIDYPAKLTRLVIGDPDNSLEWCEFKNGELIRCNSKITAMLATQPCYKIFDRVFP